MIRTHTPSYWRLTTATSLILASLLTACSTNKDRAPFTPMVVDDASAAIYIYRPKTMANAMYAPDFYVDEELKFPIKNGVYSRLKLPAGDYHLKLQAGEHAGQQTDVSLQAEMTYYIRVTTSLKIDNAAGYQPYRRGFFMEMVQEEDALKEIASCCATTLEVQADEAVSSQPDSSDTGFSVDKTQNPFSH